MSIYHLHIPRTSGIYVKNNIHPYLKASGIQTFASNRTPFNIDVVKDSKFVSGHFATSPIKFMDNPDIFCIIRNPIDRFISYFRYTAIVLVEKVRMEEKLESWLYGEQSKIQDNMQSKFLTGKINLKEFNENTKNFNKKVDNGWFVEDYCLDINYIKKSIDNMYCYTLENHNNFKEDMNKSLIKNFNFSTFKHSDKTNESIDIGINFTKSQINRIEELNSIDYEVYEYVRSIKKRY